MSLKRRTPTAREAQPARPALGPWLALAVTRALAVEAAARVWEARLEQPAPRLQLARLARLVLQ